MPLKGCSNVKWIKLYTAEWTLLEYDLKCIKPQGTHTAVGHSAGICSRFIYHSGTVTAKVMPPRMKYTDQNTVQGTIAYSLYE